MTEADSKKLASLLGSLKGTIIQNVSSGDFEKFVNWCNKLALDTRKDKIEKDLLAKIKHETDMDEKNKLIDKKKRYLPINYPSSINIGDVVHVNFGFGYCSEISDGHYGIIMSKLIANMYFVVPCSSEPLRKMPYSIKLGVPNRERDNNKISYLRFDQMRMIHYRRIEKVSSNKTYNVGVEEVDKISEQIRGIFN